MVYGQPTEISDYVEVVQECLTCPGYEGLAKRSLVGVRREMCPPSQHESRLEQIPVLLRHLTRPDLQAQAEHHPVSALLCVTAVGGPISAVMPSQRSVSVDSLL